MDTVKTTIQTLGRSAIADRINAIPSSFSNAITNGHFPASWYVALQEMAQEGGHGKIPDTLFNMKGVKADA